MMLQSIGCANHPCIAGEVVAVQSRQGPFLAGRNRCRLADQEMTGNLLLPVDQANPYAPGYRSHMLLLVGDHIRSASSQIPECPYARDRPESCSVQGHLGSYSVPVRLGSCSDHTHLCIV